MGQNFFCENHTQETPEQFRRLGQFEAVRGAGSPGVERARKRKYISLSTQQFISA